MASPSTSPSLGRPFHATRTWNLLIDFLKRNANIKKRRNLKMQCGECFTGMNAVDVLMSFSRSNSDLFSDKSINRENIVRLCQSFMDSKIIEPAFDKKGSKFQDSASALYLFPDEMPDFVLPKTKRTALRSIDGEIMNGFDQITISDSRNMATPRSSNLQIPNRNSRFPSFGGLTASSFKETFMRRMSSESEEEDALFIQKPDRRSGRKLKRSSSLVGYVIKRSSSDSNLRKEYGSSGSDNEHCDNKDENQKGGMMKFGQRLSFRKKSMRNSEQSTSHVNQPCVIKNPAVTTGIRQPGLLEKKKLNPQEINHIKRECIRVRLLQILDLPFVDCLITSPTTEKKEKDKFVWTNFSTSLKYSEVAKSYAIDDEWIKYALVVLRYLPNGYDVLRKYAREPTRMKKLGLYGAISKYYKSLSKPLIDDSMSEITENISSMLEIKPVSETLEVVQLFLHLLPESVFPELRDLINFLRHVSEHDAVAIGTGVSNETRVLQSFSKPLLSSSSFLQDRISFESSHSSFLFFLLQHADAAFFLPSATECMIRRKIELAESGDVDSPLLKPEVTFCEMITNEEYQQQRGEYTQMHLRHLSEHIMTSDIVSDKRKKVFLKKLKSSHSSVNERTNGPLKAVRKGTSNFTASTPGFIVKQRPLQAPLSDPLARRKNKSNVPIYI